MHMCIHSFATNEERLMNTASKLEDPNFTSRVKGIGGGGSGGSGGVVCVCVGGGGGVRR